MAGKRRSCAERLFTLLITPFLNIDNGEHNDTRTSDTILDIANSMVHHFLSNVSSLLQFS